MSGSNSGVNGRPALLPLALDGVPDAVWTALRQEGAPVAASGMGRPTRFVLFDSRRGPPSLRPGQHAIDVRPMLAEAPLCDELPMADLYTWRFEGLELEEQIATVDRGQRRRKFIGLLREAVEQAGGVWMRLAPTPYPYRTAFNVRLDYDEYVPEDFRRTQNLVARMPEAFSHYLCASSHAPQREALAQLHGHDVGSHGYWHYTYRNQADNRSNIQRGIDALREAGLEPHGFAAPHGRHPQALWETLSLLKIPYSSEFGCAYDDWPYRPKQGQVLQIPVHPVCLGLFMEAARRRTDARGGRRSERDDVEAAEAARRYFEQWIAGRYKAGEPIFVYGHPDGRLGKWTQVLEGMLTAAAQCGALWKTSYRRFAEWWACREGIAWSVERRGEGYTLRMEGRPKSFTPMVEFYRGRLSARFPVEGLSVEFSPDSLGYEPLVRSSLPRPRPAGRRLSFKEHVRRQLDWERTTPPEDLRDPSWRGALKKALRRMAG